MGREIKRVPVGFDWPLHRVWEGFVNPHRSRTCEACDGTGYNPETKRISDDWYAFDRPDYRWCHHITQDEVQALVDGHRLFDFTRDFVPGKGWVPKDPPVIPTADEVNEWSHHGLGHDAANRGICVKTRAKRIGVWGLCPACGGEGERWDTPEIRAAHEAWTETEPPSGDGYQLWETVSEGSPVSPAFATPEELARWLVVPGNDTSVTRGTTYDQWLAFIRGPGWAPSFISGPGIGFVPGVAAVEGE